jgi:hypothetical protein
METTVPGSGTAPPGADGLVPLPNEKLSTVTNSGEASPLTLTLIGDDESLM